MPQISTHGQPVEVELQPTSGSSAGGCPVFQSTTSHGPSGSPKMASIRPPTRETAQPQQERALGEQRRPRRRTAGQERLAQPLDPAGVAGELLVGEVGAVVELEQPPLARGAALDPGVDLGADPRRRPAEPWQRPHADQ